MGLAALYDTPTDAVSWRRWAFNHAANHYNVANAVQAQKSKTVNQFMLSPIDPNNLGMWLYWHQTMHGQTNAALGQQGYNLLELDINDPEQLQEWIQLNGTEHTAWGAVLGIG